MRKSDLIMLLNDLEGDPIIVIPSTNFELGNALVPISNVQPNTEALEYMKPCVDAFDSTLYVAKTYQSRGGEEYIVQLS